MIRAIALAFSAAMLLGSCRGITSPDASIPRTGSRPFAAARQSHSDHGVFRTGTPSAAEESQVPIVTHIESIADEHGLHFRLHLKPARRGDRPFYGPRTPGGWQFQTFLDVDQNSSTGYAHRYEYLTRDSELGLESGTLLLRRTEGGGGDGGWGEEVVRFPVHVSERLVMFTVPLDAIEDDGLVDFAVELYATVLGGEDGATPIASYCRDYSGSSTYRQANASGLRAALDDAGVGRAASGQ